MATDILSEVDARAELLSGKLSDQRRCPLTGASTFGQALELVIASESYASKVHKIEVMRSTLRGEIIFRPRGSRSRFEGSSFGRERQGQLAGLQSKYWLPGTDVLAIANEVGAIVAGKRTAISKAMEGSDGGG
ncbi:MAG: hypothetical protein P4L99_05500 [Chthoniobacter sp.]|nr:hypothetical protein [Chthoniobacter sp.]